MLRQSSRTVVREVLDNRWLRWLIILLFLIVATWVVGQVGSFLMQYLDTFLLFFIAWMLAFTLRPLAEKLQEENLPGRNHPIGWVGAVNVVYLGVLLMLVLLGWLIMPPLVEQIQNLVTFLSGSQFTDFQNWVVKQLHDLGVQDKDISNFINTFGGQALDFTRQALNFVQGLFGVIFNVIIILVLSYIFMSDGKRIADGLRNVVPVRYRDQVRLLGSSMESSFGGFLRGQFLMGLIYGSVVGIVLAVFHLNFALLAAIVTALFMLVPLIGYVAAYVPPVVIALVDSISPQHTSWAGSASWWIILIVVVVVQALIVNVIAPKIMSESVGVHPLVVFAAMLLGSKIGGVWGALFGIPIAGVINVMTGQFFNSFIKPSTWFNAEPSGWQVVESIEEQDRMEAAGDGEEASDEPGKPAGVGQTSITVSQSFAPASNGTAQEVGNRLPQMTRVSTITIADPSGDDQIIEALAAGSPAANLSATPSGDNADHKDEVTPAAPLGVGK